MLLNLSAFTNRTAAMRFVLFLTPFAILLAACVQQQHLVARLHAQSSPTTPRVVSFAGWDALPAPVARYFRFALTEGQPYVDRVELTHGGRFKTAPEKDWVSIKGKQWFTTSTPGFVWEGRTSLFRAVDAYVADEGRLRVYVLGFLRVVNLGGTPETHEAELLRWLAEGLWFPTAWLPNEHLQWHPLTDSTARLTLDHAGLHLAYTVTFAADGSVSRLDTQRYHSPERGYVHWAGYPRDYRRTQGMTIPYGILGEWLPEGAPEPYADFEVETISFTF